MRAVINGLSYDTANAVLIGKAGYSGSMTDFQWWEAGLYKTPRSGPYFLAGSGGPMTRWARSIGQNGRTGGSAMIFPMSADEAREWAERYLTVEEVEKGFADAIEDA